MDTYGNINDQTTIILAEELSDVCSLFDLFRG